MSQTELLKQLLDLCDLDDVSLMLRRVREEYHQNGLNPKQFTQLSILFTQLASIFKNV